LGRSGKEKERGRRTKDENPQSTMLEAKKKATSAFEIYRLE
jgi:hypothetical protein